MKLKIAKIEADGYTVDVTTNHNTDKWEKYIKEFNAWSVAMAWCGSTAGIPKHPKDFFTTEFNITKAR